MDAKDRFLNFPIVLLQGFLENHQECLNRIFRYSVFEMVYSDQAIFEGIEDFIEEYEFNLNPKFIPSITKEGRVLYDSCFGMNYPWTGIHIDTLSRFNKDRNKFDLVCLLLFLALKSIIQVKPYANAKDALILSRMAGQARAGNQIPEGIAYWMHKGSRRRTKVFIELEKHYKLVRAYKARGTTFSINKLNQEQLEFAILKRKDQKSTSELNNRKKHAKAEAIRKFNESKRKDHYP